MNTAPSLLELQRAFSGTVLRADNSGLAPWVTPGRLSADARLQIYRNMVFNTLTGALETSYPAVLRLVGEEFFKGAAARYIVTVPSLSGNLQDYGAAFPDFLEAMPEAAGLPYLGDVARLEWMRQEAYLAAETAPIAAEILAKLDEKDLAACRLALHPSVRLLTSRYPVLAIWQFCLEEAKEPLQLEEKGQQVLIWRAGWQIAMRPLTHAESEFIAGLLAEEPFGEVIGLPMTLDPDFSLAEQLQLLLQEDLLVGLYA